MTKTASWASVSPSVIDKVIRSCDGWSIFSVGDLIENGVPDPLVERHCAVHKSVPGNWKQTITSGGKYLPEYKGAYSLDLLYGIAGDLNCDEAVKAARSMGGRGFQARVLIAGIEKALATMAQVPTVEPVVNDTQARVFGKNE